MSCLSPACCSRSTRCWHQAHSIQFVLQRLGDVAPIKLVIDGPADGAWRLVSPSHQALCDALAAVERPAGRLRIEVDPLRV